MSRSIPVFTSLAGYQRRWLTADLVAGLTVWAVLVPEALAYATIAGVSPVVGLYAAVPALVLYAAFGSSRHLVVGPMAATAALSAAAVGDIAARTGADFTQLTAGMALVAGVIALAAGLARLGFLASFISGPVLKGFIIGLALTIIIGQLPKLFGIPKTEGDFFEQTWGLISHLGDTQYWTLLVGTVSLAVVMLLRKVAPRIPGSLVVVLGAIAAVPLFDLDAKGVDIVGPIQSGLPHLGPPDLGWTDYGALVSSAAGLVLIAFAEGLGAAKTYAARDHYPIDVNRELIGLGAANLGSSFASGMVVNGSLSKTAVNGESGARSQLSGLLVAALTIVTLLFLTGLFENLPEATLAAVVIAAVVELIDRWALVRLWRSYTAALGSIYGWAARVDLIAALAALFGVLLFDTLPGLFIGIVVSIILLVYRASRPHIAVLGRRPDGHDWVDLDRNPTATTEPGIVVVRPEAGLFYANTDNVAAAVSGHVGPETKAIVLDLASVPAIDVSAVDMLIDLDDDLQRRNVTLLVARDIGQVRDMLHAAGGDELFERVHPTTEDAVRSITSQSGGNGEGPAPDET